MLTATEKAQLRAGLDACKQQMPGYIERRPQLRLMGAVALAIAHGTTPEFARTSRRLACIEAGTGVGKSLAICLAGMVMARSRGLKLIISTSTATLQSQIINKDAPAAMRALDLPFTVAIAKGRARYICPLRLQQCAAGLAEHDAADQDEAPTPDAELVALSNALSNALSAGTWNGDRDALAIKVDDASWSKLSTDSDGCAGKSCAHYAECPYYAAREKMRDADLIVTNHAYMIAASAAPAGALLPDLSQCAVVFDEAHGLPACAVSSMRAATRMRPIETWVKSIPEMIDRITSAFGFDFTPYEPANSNAQTLINDARLLVALLNHTPFPRADGAANPENLPVALPHSAVLRFARGLLPESVAQLCERMRPAADALLSALIQLRESIMTGESKDPTLAMPAVSMLAQPIGHLRSLVATLAALANGEDADGPTAKWIERRSRSAGVDYGLNTSPTCAAGMLRRAFWDKAAACILTSATMTSCGKFDAFLEDCGLASFPALPVMRLTSPFDYANAAELVVPAMSSDPRDSAAHTEELISLLPGLLEPAGSLILFASRRQLRAVVARMPADIRARMLVQGEASNAALVTEHKRRVDAGESSILVGLAAFSEGLDLPAHYCSLVVIAKLPFSSVDDPIVAARSEWLEAHGQSSFEHIALPAVAVRLAQSVGRLLRTETDRGKIAVLDRRLASTRWGRRLLAGLPPFRLNLACAAQ